MKGSVVAGTTGGVMLGRLRERTHKVDACLASICIKEPTWTGEVDRADIYIVCRGCENRDEFNTRGKFVVETR